MYHVTLDHDQRMAILQHLKAQELEEFLPHVEAIISGDATPDGVIRLIHAAYQKGKMEGRTSQLEATNRALKSITQYQPPKSDPAGLIRCSECGWLGLAVDVSTYLLEDGKHYLCPRCDSNNITGVRED